MSDFFALSLDEALPKKMTKVIEDLDEPKKNIDPTLAARLKQKPSSPQKTSRSPAKKYNLKIANFELDSDDFGKLALTEVLPVKNPRAVELIDPPRRPITNALASRLCGTAA